MGWRLDDYRALVEKRMGSQVLARVRPVITSLAWKFALARFHATRAREEFTSHFDEEGEQEIIEAVGKLLRMASGEEESEAFARSRFVVEANVIAGAQALHSTADVLAYALYHGLGLADVKALPDDGINPYIVREQMAERGEFPRGASALGDFLKSEEFRYLRAYVNTAKHKRLVDAQYLIQLDPWEQARHGIRIRPFEYETRRHGVEKWPEKWVDDLLGSDLESISTMVAVIGNTVNEELREHLKSMDASDARA